MTSYSQIIHFITNRYKDIKHQNFNFLYLSSLEAATAKVKAPRNAVRKQNK
jgi:hypothetical protein